MGRLGGEAPEDEGLEPGQERQGEDERADPEGEAAERRGGDDPDLRVPPRRQDVAAGQQEAGQRPDPRGLMSGKRMTSRIEREFEKSIASRSMPIPSPAVGGMPYESAST